MWQLPEGQYNSKPLDSGGIIRLVYDVGDAHAVWKIGKAYLKAKIIQFTGETKEHSTLEGVKDMGLSCKLPEVLYHNEWDGRYYLVVSEVVGQRLAEAWPDMSSDAKAQCVQCLVQVCEELAGHRSDRITGLDGRQLIEPYLSNDGDEDYTSAALLRFCESLGMDCSQTHLYHTDLGPTNVFVVTQTDGSIDLGIIDWEAVGYVPKDWVRTKFRLSGGMDLEHYDFEDKRRYEWRTLVQRALGQRGYADVADQWMEKQNR